MTRKIIALLHAAYWVIYLLIIALVLAVLSVQFPRAPSIGQMVLSPVGLVTIAPNALSFYFGYGFVFDRFLARRRIAATCVAGSLGAFGSVGLILVSLYLRLGGDQPVFSSAFELTGLAVPLVAVALLHAAMALGMRGFIGWYGDLQLKEELNQRTREVEMALVRSKIDPHFLFNTINNIDVLIARDPATASSYLNKLSEILRFVLYETRAESIPLADELAYIEKYIALERIRTAHPAFVSYDARGDRGSLVIAPMVLIPIIENAFKHTDDRRTDGAIHIEIQVGGATLSMTCRNANGRSVRPTTDPGGLGNDLIRQRLALLYPSRHTLEVTDRDGVYTVSLTLNLDAPPLHHR